MIQGLVQFYDIHGSFAQEPQGATEIGLSSHGAACFKAANRDSVAADKAGSIGRKFDLSDEPAF